MTGDSAGTRTFVIVLFVLALLALIYVAAQIVSGLAVRSAWHDTPPASPASGRAGTAIAPPANPPPAAAANPDGSLAQGLKGNPAMAFSADAYPAEALRRGEQGRVRALLAVGADGHVTDCHVEGSSGSSSLDQATCAIALNRVTFQPARDTNGIAVPATYHLAVRWVLPQD